MSYVPLWTLPMQIVAAIFLLVYCYIKFSSFEEIISVSSFTSNYLKTNTNIVDNTEFERFPLRFEISNSGIAPDIYRCNETVQDIGMSVTIRYGPYVNSSYLIFNLTCEESTRFNTTKL
jgi:hypothetical protein